MKNHVTKLFLKWHERRLSDRDRIEVERHLKQCDACRKYYEKLSAVFDDRSLLAIGDLLPDPYLPSRIKALHESTETGPRRLVPPILRWSLAGAGATLAVVIGTYIGSGLYNDQQTGQASSDMSEYHDVISQHGSIDQWDYSAGSSEGDRQ
ncbi:MAG TPA: zf-HC2 domain-containing protein [Bacteroidota bacterium]|nr:zf-HC2 domain-containing protein [Bacteroidota bacterium]